MKRREFVQLAHNYDAKKHLIGGWFASEKLDGMRALWDGGITRGLACEAIPFANTAKDGRLLVEPVSTGLWSRSGKVIHAPEWFLDQLPRYPLDGELYAGRGNFQQTMSGVKKHKPIDEEWCQIDYHVFDLPDYSMMFADGRINTPNFSKELSGVTDWLKALPNCKWAEPKLRRFETVNYLLNTIGNDVVKVVTQVQLPFGEDAALEIVNERLDRICSEGGEGLILRSPNSIWTPQRSHQCLKVKSFQDDEVTVTGYIWGRETDKGSKLLGLMGAMITDFNGKRLEVSGFTDEERVMTPDPRCNSLDRQEGYLHAGKEISEIFTNEKFPVGSTITIRYRELSDDGICKEGRFWRKHES